jgi:hypothetical protein
MPKQKLGTGNKRAVLQRPGTSYTSPNAIKLQQRRAAALDYRLQGHAYHRIAKVLSCHPSTAHDYVVKALRDIVPREKAEAVLQLELARLDAMQGAIFANAAGGDIPSIDACLRITHQRARLLGLYPNDKHNSLHVSVGDPDRPNAEDTGIQVTFVRPSRRPEDAGKVVDGKLVGPVLNHSEFNGGSKS